MSARETIRVILADDHTNIHIAVATLLDYVDDIVLIGQASNGHEALDLCAEYEPDLVLMDVMMPGMTGIEATTILKERFPHIKILVLSSFQDDESLQAMLNSGADGYVLKMSLSDDLVTSIRAVHSGQSVFSSEIVKRLIVAGNKSPDLPTDFGLTEREMEVLQEMAKGITNDEIAAALSISRSTVKFHVSNIISKLGADSRVEAVAIAARNSLI